MSYLKFGLDHLESLRMRRSVSLSTRAVAQHLLILLLATSIFPVQAELYFNPRFLADDPAAVADLSSFEKGQELPPGTYRVDIYMNGGYMTTRDVTFSAGENGHGLMPCLTRGQLVSMGLNTAAVSGINALASETCVPLTEMIKDATIRLDVGQQRLYLTIPQAFMGNQARGYIPPELWDNGINAGLLNYNFTGNNVDNAVGGSSQYAYLNLQSGVNLGAWRLRDNSTWSYTSGGSSASNENKWQHVNTWLERDITPIRSRLTLGDSYTNGDVFDGINFRGAQLASDDNMLPDSQKGFAPVIHGIARGTAQVSVKQNGYEIYHSTVPPGPFSINDLYAAGNGGDLQVSIKEADGSSQNFTVPYSSVPVLQREGHTRYAITAGEYRSGNEQQEEPSFFQSTLLHGLPAGWTLYGGTQLADRYRAFNMGLGKNMGDWGALSMDITQANATLPDDSKHQGQSVRFLYNKSLSELGTNIQLVGYRYSTRGYFSFADTAYRRMSGYDVETQDGVIHVQPKFTDYYNLAYSKRGKVQMSVTQQLGRTATLYVSGSHQTYWGTGNADEQLQVGLNTAVDDINWTLSYSLTKSAWQEGRDQMLAVNVNIPFSHWMRSDNTSAWRQASASYSMSNDMKGRMTNLAGLYGTVLEDNNLSYSVQTGYSGGGEGNSGGSGYAALNYRGGYGNANVGYSHSDGIKQLYYGMSGGVLAHANGITFGQPLNDTVVLIKAPGAEGTKVENQTGVRTDWRGYAVLPYATEYRENRVALDTNTLADNVDLDDAVVNVVPTHGAIVRAEFKAQVGMKLLMTLTRGGKPVPFGAVVTADNNQNSSIVADNGQVYLSGMPAEGKVRVKWGEGAAASCTANYRVPVQSQQQMLSQLSAVCH
ncbi:MAG: fimbrial biogenesis usher protein [Kluyvera cryocrescens]|uniref:Fimbrial biogenesis usher protein n=1 Tax=Kluyvera cryocrescens TaxID=580 RepID=A0AAW9C283_KLUCR|nr:fimbrial biogenesis usher protein [Kluyvera cryocrescens]MDU5686700.1 fimbrial biogenesis usher protein [Kluyvera cryocrescens]MDW3776356.1 fimbrial biogenesis usher protein [Kluyvera cryocrescens]MEB6633872.1 fimbrial biogenesis usher protein [Kluyvera cryocrescens]SQC35166.1 Outer membrane usher protein fimD precursor [Kluyvera cryocrescens]HAT1572547.1 fimbrial biogenesis usher protein [Kluyvera cryocrescens]